MSIDIARIRSGSLLLILCLCAILLSGHLLYLFLADKDRFPINTIKIVANYEYISRKQLESVLSLYANDSYFTLPTSRLKKSLSALEWSDGVDIEKIWPDSLKIVVKEKSPVALWNAELMTADGHVFPGAADNLDHSLPRLSGPVAQQTEVLQNYQKLSNLLTRYGLQASELQLRDNQAWELTLTSGVVLKLGKRDIEQRLAHFCKAYIGVFAEKQDQLVSVDMRYAHGMAVLWKQQAGK